MHRSSTHLRRPALLLVAASCVLTGGTAAVAQCSNVWQPGEGLPGFDQPVDASCLWDPDGPGPMGLHAVFGGAFTIAGDVAADHVVARDLASGAWLQLGAGLPGRVSALHVRPNGELIAGGRFSGQVARWTGSSWQTFGAALHPIAFYPEVYDFAELPNGDLAACGMFFVFSGGVFCGDIARWDGTAWHGLGSGLSAAPTAGAAIARSMAVLGNGDLVVTGSFATAGGVAVPNLARWNGSSWSGLGAGPGIAGGAVHVLPNGDLLTGGYDQAGGTLMSRWDGVQWQSFGPSFGPGGVWSISEAANGDLLVGGQFSFAASRNVVRWDGAAWSEIGEGVGWTGIVSSMHELPGGEILVAGTFLENGTYQRTNAAVFDGDEWSPIAGGFDGVVRAATLLPNGHIVVGGYFKTAGGQFANSIAEWDGAAWQPLGTGLGGMNNHLEGVECLVTLPGGDLVVGGRFASAGGVAVDNIARWDGTTWSPIGVAVGNAAASLRAMVVMPNGDLIVGGYFDSIAGVPALNIARWDGVSWSPLGPGVGVPGSNGCRALAVSPDGDLVATGFSQAGGQAARVARWDGAAWTPIGSLPQGVGLELLFEPNGDLLVAGTFWFSGSYDNQPLWRWNGQVWSAVGPLMQNGLYALEMDALLRQGGDVLAGGTFGTAPGVSVPNLARWNGSSWSPLGGGTDGRVRAMLQLPDGDVLVGGEFVHAGGLIRPALARLGTTCPATVTTIGATCASASGPMQLTIDALPWTGGAFASTCTGIDPSAVAFSLFGFSSPGVALSALHPLGAPGCVLWSSTEASWYQPAIGGVASCALPIPNAPSLVGATLTHQFVEFEFGPGGLVRIGSSDGRALTIGTF